MTAVIVHVAVLAMSDILTIMHIARARLHGLSCEQYKYGQKNVFHSTIIHLYAVLDVFDQSSIILEAVFERNESGCHP